MGFDGFYRDPRPNDLTSFAENAGLTVNPINGWDITNANAPTGYAEIRNPAPAQPANLGALYGPAPLGIGPGGSYRDLIPSINAPHQAMFNAGNPGTGIPGSSLPGMSGLGNTGDPLAAYNSGTYSGDPAGYNWLGLAGGALGGWQGRILGNLANGIINPGIQGSIADSGPDQGGSTGNIRDAILGGGTYDPLTPGPTRTPTAPGQLGPGPAGSQLPPPIIGAPPQPGGSFSDAGGMPPPPVPFSGANAVPPASTANPGAPANPNPNPGKFQAIAELMARNQSVDPNQAFGANGAQYVQSQYDALDQTPQSPPGPRSAGFPAPGGRPPGIAYPGGPGGQVPRESYPWMSEQILQMLRNSPNLGMGFA